MNVTQLEPTATLAQLQVSKPDKVTIVLLSGDLIAQWPPLSLPQAPPRWECRLPCFLRFGD